MRRAHPTDGEHVSTTHQKYPRTPHLGSSPGASSDDVWSQAAFVGEDVVITEKMDGENTTLYRDHLHARSLDSRHHPSRSWVKGLHQRIKHQIPRGWRVCGENCYARHSIEYEQLASYFLVFSIWDEHNTCLSWAQTMEWCALLELTPVPVLYTGPWTPTCVEQTLSAMNLDEQEGVVVRVARAFAFEDFATHLAKWVRPNHVQTSTHWMMEQVHPNGLKGEG